MKNTREKDPHESCQRNVGFLVALENKSTCAKFAAKKIVGNVLTACKCSFRYSTTTQECYYIMHRLYFIIIGIEAKPTNLAGK